MRFVLRVERGFEPADAGLCVTGSGRECLPFVLPGVPLAVVGVQSRLELLLCRTRLGKHPFVRLVLRVERRLEAADPGQRVSGSGREGLPFFLPGMPLVFDACVQLVAFGVECLET